MHSWTVAPQSTCTHTVNFAIKLEFSQFVPAFTKVLPMFEKKHLWPDDKLCNTNKHFGNSCKTTPGSIGTELFSEFSTASIPARFVMGAYFWVDDIIPVPCHCICLSGSGVATVTKAKLRDQGQGQADREVLPTQPKHSGIWHKTAFA